MRVHTQHHNVGSVITVRMCMEDSADSTMMCTFKAFNTACKEMMRDLMELRPSSSDLRMLYTSYKVVKMFNRRTPHQFFEETLGPFEKQLLCRDLSFLLDPTRSCAESESMCDLQRMTRDMWPGFSELDRERIWEHVNKILRLHRHCKTLNAFEADRALLRIPAM